MNKMLTKKEMSAWVKATWEKCQKEAWEQSEMTRDEYNVLFHKLHLNRVAFKPLFECDKEVLALVNAAIDEERKRWVSENTDD